VLVSVAGGALSVAFAGAVALSARASWIPVLVSYAVGALLGAAFLETLPHAFELSRDAKTAAVTLMLGILGFFLLEKLVLWRHHHAHEDGVSHHHLADGHDHGRSGLMIMVGNTVHNFVDGALIAAAFLADVRLGVVTSLAIIAHEIPQEVGDFLILLHSGYTKTQTFALNLLSCSPISCWARCNA
jgi:zinc and cadmium transporter